MMNNSAKSFFIINYLYIFLAINYSIFVRFIIGFDSAGYGLSLLSVIVFLLNLRDFNRLQLRKPILFWLVWCIYAFLNYYLHPHINHFSIVDLYRRIFVPLIAMTVVLKEFQNNPNKLLWMCFITHAVYMVFGLYFDKGVIYGDMGAENVLGNDFALISCFTLFYLAVLNRLKSIPFLWTVLFMLIIIVIVSMTGTRKAFGAGCLIIAFWAFSFLKQQKVGTWVLIVIFVLVGIKGYQTLLDKTFIGQRMEFLEEQQEDALPQGAPEFLSIFGDRASHYYYGWQIFKSHPLLGVGTGQSLISSGSYIHSEYMVQLTDGGILAAFLLLMFLWWVGKCIYKRIKIDRQMCLCIAGGFIAILFIYLTAWGWEFPNYFICLGVLIGYCKVGVQPKNE